MKEIWVKKQILELFYLGKVLEVRPRGWVEKQNLHEGDECIINKLIPCVIISIRFYQNGIIELLKNEESQKIYPGKSFDELHKFATREFGRRYLAQSLCVIELKLDLP